jgi:TPR repeat protein
MSSRATTIALAGCFLAVGCARQPSREDPSFDASAAKRISLTFGQGACAEIAECSRKCDAGEADQCRRLGDTLLFADGGQDETRATAYYERACGLGNAPACLSAGHMYARGEGRHGPLTGRGARGSGPSLVSNCVARRPP